MKVSKKKLTHDEWIEERRKGIGSSDAPAILGLNPWKTPLDVYQDKIGESQPAFENEKMEMGKRMEPVIAQAFADRTGYMVRNDNFIRVHPQFNFMIANLDRLIYDKTKEDGPGIIEIKNSSHAMLNKYEGIPPMYFAQLQHQFMVTGYVWGFLVFLLDGWELRPFDIRADKDYHNFMIEEEEKFWTKNVMQRIPPLPVTQDEIKKAYRNSVPGTIVEATLETWGEVQTLKNLKNAQKNIEKKIESKENEIMMILKEKENLMYFGDVLATWKSNEVNRFDTKEFQAKHPDIYQQYLKSNVQRRFLIK